MVELGSNLEDGTAYVTGPCILGVTQARDMTSMLTAAAFEAEKTQAFTGVPIMCVLILEVLIYFNVLGQ